MIYAHILMAVLATWRITELFTQDRITDRLRKKFPTYLWQCPRCMSVWAGGWSALLIVLSFLHLPYASLIPWLNWPFALSWLYFIQIDARVSRRLDTEGRRFVVEGRGQNWTLTRNDFTPVETQEILVRLLSSAQPQVQPAQPPQHANGAAVQ